MKLWDAATGALLRTFESLGRGHFHCVLTRWHPPLSGSADKTLKLWDAATGAPLRTFEGHSSWVHSVAFSPDGTPVLSGRREDPEALGRDQRGAAAHLRGHLDLSATRRVFTRWDAYPIGRRD